MGSMASDALHHESKSSRIPELLDKNNRAAESNDFSGCTSGRENTTFKAKLELISTLMSEQTMIFFYSNSLASSLRSYQLYCI